MTRTLTVFAWVLLVPAALFAAPERRFAELLPESTVGYFEASAITDSERAKAIAYRCLEEPEMRKALDRLMAEEGNFSRGAIPMGRGTLRFRADIRESGAAFDLEFAHPRGTERVRFRDNLAIAWVGLGEGGPFGVDAVAALQVDGDSVAAYRFARRLVGAIQKRGKRGKRGKGDPLPEYQHAGVDCTVVDIEGVKVHFAAVGSRLVVATTRVRLADVIDRSKKPTSKSLGDEERFVATQKHATGDGSLVMLMHLNVDRGVEQVAAKYPHLAGMRQWLGMAGLGGLRTISSTSRVDGAGIAGTTSVIVEGRRTGLSRLFEKDEAAKFGTLAFAPKETLYVASGRFNPPALMRVVAETAGMVVSSTSQVIYQETGINLYEDVIKVIGPEAALIYSTNDGLVPDIGIVLESSNPKRLEQTVLKALSKVDWKPGTGVFATHMAGKKAHVIKVMHPQMAEIPIAPTFGVVDGHFVIALYPISYQRFANTKAGRRRGIAANPDYVTLRKRVPVGALSMSYLDLRRAVSTVYDTVIPLLQSMPEMDGGTPIYEMPEASLFTQHMYGRVAWRVADDRGMHWHSHSSVDLTPLAIGMAGGIAASLSLLGRGNMENTPEPGDPKWVKGPQVVSAPGAEDQKVREVRRCARNVRELLQVLRFYQKRNDALPNSLDDVAKGWRLTPRQLEVPGHPGKRYRYYGPAGKGGILLAGLANGPDGNICVITTDLKMSRITPERLHEKLEHDSAGK